AGARTAEQHDDLARADRQIDAVDQHAPVGQRDAQTADGQARHCANGSRHRPADVVAPKNTGTESKRRCPIVRRRNAFANRVKRVSGPARERPAGGLSTCLRISKLKMSKPRTRSRSPPCSATPWST